MSSIEVVYTENQRMDQDAGYKFMSFNTSGKVIKYIYYTYEAYNRVGDMYIDPETGASEFNGKITGPIEPFDFERKLMLCWPRVLSLGGFTHDKALLHEGFSKEKSLKDLLNTLSRRHASSDSREEFRKEIIQRLIDYDVDNDLDDNSSTYEKLSLEEAYEKFCTERDLDYLLDYLMELFEREMQDTGALLSNFYNEIDKVLEYLDNVANDAFDKLYERDDEDVKFCYFYDLGYTRFSKADRDSSPYIAVVRLKEVKIEFMDGSEEVIPAAQITNALESNSIYQLTKKEKLYPTIDAVRSIRERHKQLYIEMKEELQNLEAAHNANSAESASSSSWTAPVPSTQSSSNIDLENAVESTITAAKELGGAVAKKLKGFFKK